MSNPVQAYINTLPLHTTDRYVLLVMANSHRRIFTQAALMKLCGMTKRTIRHHLYRLHQCEAVSRRDPGHSQPWHYWISDIRLLHHMAAKAGGFAPLDDPAGGHVGPPQRPGSPRPDNRNEIT